MRTALSVARTASTPAVSVIVLTFNSERHILRCLQHLAAQTIQNFEVVVVDAGSSDKTKDICSSFREDILVRWIDAPGTNMGEARNIGIEAATGDYLAYCDSDDYFGPKKLEASLSILQGESGAHVAYGSFMHFTIDGSTPPYEPRELVKTLGQEPRLFLAGQQVNINSLLVSRSGLSHVKFAEDEGGRYGEDWQYLMSLAAAGARFKPLDGTHSFIEIRDGSHTTWDIQHFLKWYVIRHMYRLKDEFFEIGCDQNYWRKHLVRHWAKFYLACAAAGDVDFPNTAMKSDGEIRPPLLRLYTWIKPILKTRPASQILRKLWLYSRRRKFVR